MIFFLNDTATTEIYTLSLHDALPIFRRDVGELEAVARQVHGRSSMIPRHAGRNHLGRRSGDSRASGSRAGVGGGARARSEEHTSELQSRQYLVCRLLLEKKNKTNLYY